MNNLILHIITILIFCSVSVSAQNINSYSRKKMFKFGICSPKNQSLNSTVRYYNRNNIEITTTFGLDFVMSPYSKEKDSIKTIKNRKVFSKNEVDINRKLFEFLPEGSKRFRNIFAPSGSVVTESVS